MREEISGRIQLALGGRVAAAQPLAGGMISRVLRIDLADGARAVAKIGDGGHDLRIEGFMLDYLREHTALPVPQVFLAEPDLLLMEFIDGESGWDERNLAHLGRLLAACHEVEGDSYGLERDTLTGPLRQPNKPTKSWIAFFREQRLLYTLGIARDSGELPSELELRLRRLADELDRWLIKPRAPALIHGDMWRTNVLARAGRVVGILDPALYYAHNEMELAYMTLFDGVGETFFRVYSELHPIDQGFERRRHIYNLYPLLVHLIIFGAKYLRPLDESLKRYGC